MPRHSFLPVCKQSRLGRRDALGVFAPSRAVGFRTTRPFYVGLPGAGTGWTRWASYGKPPF